VSKARGLRVAAVWLPLPAAGSLADATLYKWLYRADLDRRAAPAEPVDALAALVDGVVPSEGRASLRFYGQTGDSPSVWMAAADPVYLEPRLDHLVLHAHHAGRLPAPELRAIINHLQETLAGAGDYAFARVGQYVYLRSEQPLATAVLSAQAVHQTVPTDWMPGGDDAADYRRHLSEIEMALHDHPDNVARSAEGRRPVNSLWLWGGGTLPDVPKQSLPTLYSNEPLLVGFWRRAGASFAPYPVPIEEILAISETGFATMIPYRDDNADDIETALSALRTALHSGRLDEVRLSFANGLVATVRPRHRYRYWRTSSPVPELVDEAVA
jgi:hypothetical protein